VLALVSTSLVPASGCSALFVRPLPENYQHMARVRCTRNTTAPVIDTLVAGLEAIRTAYAFGLSESDYNGMPLTRSTDILVGASFVAVYGASAAYGFYATNKCREALDDDSPRPRSPVRPRRTIVVPAPPPAEPAPPAPEVPAAASASPSPDGAAPPPEGTTAPPEPVPSVPQEGDDEEPVQRKQPKLKSSPKPKPTSPPVDGERLLR